MRRILTFLGIASCTVLLSGCLGDLVSVSCGFMSNGDHCYQTAGVQEADPETCDRIQGVGFQGSNPPRDKCLLKIAENTGDTGACNGVRGGAMSYTKAECVQGAVTTGQKEVQGILNKSNPTDADILAAQKKMADMQKLQEMMTNIQKTKMDMMMTPVRNLRG